MWMGAALTCLCLTKIVDYVITIQTDVCGVICMYERMLDKQEEPTLEDMYAYCGGCAPLFVAINDFVAEMLQTEQSIRFPYGNKYGWCVSHHVKTKLICNVFAERDAFTVMLRLTDKQFHAVYEKVGSDMQRKIDERYPCGDGGWLHVRVTNQTTLQDVKELLRQKLPRKSQA